MLLAFPSLMLIVAALVTPASETRISLESLLREMIDRDSTAQFPDPPFTCRQFSSYDRLAVEPGGPDWFANRDNCQYLRRETRDGRSEEVLMDARGPGAIVRFWVTSEGPGHGDGILRFYLDGADEPVIEGQALEVISGDLLARPPLAESVPPTAEPSHRGHNLYLPIPYARSCKVTFEPADERPFFYQINYRTYRGDTPVTTFSLEQLEEMRVLCREVEYRLSRGDMPLEAAAGRTGSLAGRLAPGAARTLSLDGPGALREIVVNVEAVDRDQALRSTVLAASFDGEQTIWCPVGDFFGTGHQVHAFRTFYTAVTANGTMAARWVMPFQRTAEVTLRNCGEQPVDVTLGRVAAGIWEWDARSMHFHATWYELYRERTHGHTGARDVNYVTVHGQGLFMGDTLTLFNGTEGWGWWGEGDEKIYVDGESFPSHFGTGTEDYYGYAWARPQRFESAFHAQPCGAGNEYGGYATNTRYRGLDAIPFTTMIRFDMELWHHRDTFVNYAPATFWYALPGARSNVSPDPSGAANKVARVREDVVRVFRVNGALEGETMTIREKTGGETEVQQGLPGQWSGEKQLWWRDGAPGDRLFLEFESECAGSFAVAAGLTKANDYGIVEIAINGTASLQLYDRYFEQVSDEEVALGRFEILQGTNSLTVKITGANDLSIKRHMFGLDYIRLVPQQR